MIKCKKCNVFINTDVNICPLCQNELETNHEGVKNIFPIIEPIMKNGLWKQCRRSHFGKLFCISLILFQILYCSI